MKSSAMSPLYVIVYMYLHIDIYNVNTVIEQRSYVVMFLIFCVVFDAVGISEYRHHKHVKNNKTINKSSYNVNACLNMCDYIE